MLKQQDRFYLNYCNGERNLSMELGSMETKSLWATLTPVPASACRTAVLKGPCKQHTPRAQPCPLSPECRPVSTLASKAEDIRKNRMQMEEGSFYVQTGEWGLAGCGQKGGPCNLERHSWDGGEGRTLMSVQDSSVNELRGRQCCMCAQQPQRHWGSRE